MRTVQIVGPGSDRCLAAERLVKGFVERCAPGCTVEIIRDPEAATVLEVFAIPGVIVDGSLKSVGRVPDEDELTDWLLPTS